MRLWPVWGEAHMAACRGVRAECHADFRPAGRVRRKAECLYRGHLPFTRWRACSRSGPSRVPRFPSRNHRWLPSTGQARLPTRWPCRASGSATRTSVKSSARTNSTTTSLPPGAVSLIPARSADMSARSSWTMWGTSPTSAFWRPSSTTRAPRWNPGPMDTTAMGSRFRARPLRSPSSCRRPGSSPSLPSGL